MRLILVPSQWRVGVERRALILSVSATYYNGSLRREWFTVRYLLKKWIFG